MATRELEAAVREREGIAVIDLHGDVNSAAETALNDAYVDATGRGPGAVVLNFSRADYINSTGIALIVQLLGRAQADGRSVLAYGLSDHYKQIFDITHLSDFIPLFGDEDDALASVSGAA